MAFEFAVAAIDLEVVFLFEGFDEGGHVDVAVVLDADEGEAFVAGGGEEFEAVSSGPTAQVAVSGVVSGVAVLEAFFGDFLEFVFEGVDVGDAGGGRGHVFGGVFFELDEVEVVAAVGDGFCAVESALADGEESEARGQGEGFLGAGEEDVYAEFVHGCRDDAEGGDGVHDEEDVGKLPHDVAKFGEGVERAGGGFVVDEGDGVHFAVMGFEDGVELIGEDGVAPLGLALDGVFAAALGDVEPLVGEGTVHAVDDAFFDEVADGAFHDAPGGGGAEEDGAGGAKEGAQIGLDGGDEVFEVLAAVADHGLAECGVGARADVNGSRDEEFGWHGLGYGDCAGEGQLFVAVGELVS